MQGICSAQREELRVECLGAVVLGVDVLFLVEPLFRLPQQGKGKQPQLDNIGGDTP